MLRLNTREINFASLKVVQWCTGIVAESLYEVKAIRLADLNLSPVSPLSCQMTRADRSDLVSQAALTKDYLVSADGIWVAQEEGIIFESNDEQENKIVFQLTTNVCMSNKMSILFYGKLWQTYFSFHLCLKHMIHDQLDEACCHKYTECLYYSLHYKYSVMHSDEFIQISFRM